MTNLAKFHQVSVLDRTRSGMRFTLIGMVSYGTTKRTLGHDDSNVPRLIKTLVEQTKAEKFDENSGSETPGM